jgi:hypothetical protein
MQRRQHEIQNIDVPYRGDVIRCAGGPVSSNYPFLQGGTLNSQGVTVAWSATSTPTSPTSNFFICGGLDAVVPFITHACEWQKGVLTCSTLLSGPASRRVLFHPCASLTLHLHLAG